MQQNMGSIGKQTIASGAIIGAANIYASEKNFENGSLRLTPYCVAWASQIYQASDAPAFHTGNTINIALSGAAAVAPADARAAVADAAAAAERTRDIDARAGRSAYVERDVLRRERVPDPGAWGVKVVLEALFSE